MEKLDYLLFGDAASVRSIAIDGVTVFVGDTDEAVPSPPLLLGRGPELGGVASVWLDSVDERGPIEQALRDTGLHVDGYLVTESVPQKRSSAPALVHFTWFAKPERLSMEDFLHGWHEVHTPSTFALHPTRCEYVRDTVARCVTPGSPRVDAIVFEMFPTVEDYADPRKLFGSKEALDETSKHLSLFADYDDLNSRPLFAGTVSP
jgi:hypothetical protein